jgi:sulfonate transport system ATP-binding protein
MLNINVLCKSYTGPDGKEIRVLHNCNLHIEPGTFTVILGRSGCGKTTLLKLIAGLEKADAGTVEFSASALAPTSPPKPPTPKFGFMFQDPRLLPWLTVEQNLALAWRSLRTKTEKQMVHEEIQKVLSMVGLEDRAQSRPGELSGGMAQRAALARCLCRKPDILLLDEPLSSLDAFTRTRLRHELDKLWQELGLTVILVTHDIEEAIFLGSRVLLMEGGAMKNEFDIVLTRPRDYRSAEFQEYCRKIEDEILHETES